MHGHWGRLLHVDLTSGRASHEEIDGRRLRQYLGGIGLGVSLFHARAPAAVDPLSPDNPLVFASAPLVGTGLTTSLKFAVVTKSPLTGLLVDSLSSGDFALELKRLGIDALVVAGRSPSPAYLFIHGDRVRIRPAGHLRGRTPDETESLIRAEWGAAVRVAAIGAAGENLVRFASIGNGGRHAGRGGTGAVMGSKNLKAVAVCGDRDVAVADPAGVAALADSLRASSVGPLTDKYRTLGTVANLAVFNRLAALPTRNFRQATFEDAEALSGESLAEDRVSRRRGCASCTIRCERLFTSANGEEQRLEYETVFALGALCGISDPEHVIQAARLCDRYGLDTISTGGTLAWAMDSAGQGLLPEALALGLRFGGGDAVLAAIPAIAARQGVGALLAEGSRRAAREVGGGSDRWAMHVKGLELPGYEPRTLKTMALALAVGTRGACHNRSPAYEADFSGEVDRFRGDPSRGAMVAAAEDSAAVLDSLVVCRFLRKCLRDPCAEAAELLRAVTGGDWSAAEVRLAGERIHTLKKVINIREGWQPADDWLPDRLLDESVAAGPDKAARVSPEELRAMLRGYYAARGWADDGFVPGSKLEELEIRSRTSGAGS
ncbi:MAG TPA: aldehyde ferredoxin oxidoreductase family protein [Vicinamibacterales bacterium]|nr:aldehyde ferredoxin oxidoreductase family protein [Vicinamibacterales bacterium]